MQFTVNVHASCTCSELYSRKMMISRGDIALAETLNISEEQAHVLGDLFEVALDKALGLG